MEISIRKAERGDTGLIFRFVCELADYERLSGDVTATPEILEESLFDKNQAEAIIAEYNGLPAGFALFFHNFSTFKGRACLYLEDIFVRREYRGKGVGKALFSELIAIAKERGCDRFDWSVLDWNTPSKEFYRSLGAEEMSDWRIFRLTKDKY
jgi:GNAT superfamily N-acetyltransferase